MSRGRSLATEDRARILRELGAHGAHDFERLRLRAMALLAMSSGLRITELVSLNVEQVIGKDGRLRTVGHLEDSQAKDGNGGPFTITRAPRAALRDYIKEARARKWLGSEGALFVAMRRGKLSGGDARSHPRLSRVSAWRSWVNAQERAGIVQPYRFHDLRHESGTRFADVSNGNVFKVAGHMRLKDIRTAQTYVHDTHPEQLAELAELAMKDKK